ncbi:MAG: beta-lactamase family protein, partial [Cyclobacteriaceae bacterium]|nr:beta-lactamase family protein [Cyclobacteriaceae bacterium]
MKIKKRYIFTGLVILLGPALFIQSTEGIQNNKPTSVKKEVVPENPYLKDFISTFDSTIQTIVKKTPGAAIVIVRGDSIIFNKGYGIKSIKTGDSIDVNTVFRIGSLSKGFASTLTGVIAQDSSLQFNDLVTDHVPDFKLKTEEQTQTLSINHLLSHSTGLMYQAYTTMIEDGVPLETMISALQDVNIIGSPGQYYSYQNVGFSVIEKVLENSTGKKYETLLTTTLFQPLNMTSSSVTYENFKQEKNKALPHVYGKNGWYQRAISPNYYNTKAAGGVNASIYDMGQWLKALLGHRSKVIQASTLDSLFSPHIRTYIRYKYFSKWPNAKKAYYGLGWRIVENGNDTVIYHGGFVNNYSSKIAFIPSEDIGICVLTNSSNSFIGKSIPLFLNQYDTYR